MTPRGRRVKGDIKMKNRISVTFFILMLTEMNSSLSSTLPNIAITNIATILSGVITASLCRHIFPCQSFDKAQRKYLPSQTVGDIGYVAFEPGALIYALLDFSLDYSFEIRYLRYAALKRVFGIRISRHTVVVRRPRTEQICPQFRKPLTVKLYLLVKVVQLRQLFKRHLTVSSRRFSCLSSSDCRQCRNGHSGLSPPVCTRNTQCLFGQISGTDITSLYFLYSRFKYAHDCIVCGCPVSDGCHNILIDSALHDEIMDIHLVIR